MSPTHQQRLVSAATQKRAVFDRRALQIKMRQAVASEYAPTRPTHRYVVVEQAGGDLTEVSLHRTEHSSSTAVVLAEKRQRYHDRLRRKKQTAHFVAMRRADMRGAVPQRAGLRFSTLIFYATTAALSSAECRLRTLRHGENVANPCCKRTSAPRDKDKTSVCPCPISVTFPPAFRWGGAVQPRACLSADGLPLT